MDGAYDVAFLDVAVALDWHCNVAVALVQGPYQHTLTSSIKFRVA